MDEQKNLIVPAEFQRREVAVQPEPQSLLQAIVRAASDPATDLEKIERLYALHERVLKDQREIEFNAAFSRAQAKMPVVATNAANTQTNSKYAKLAAIVKAIAPIYTAEGFSVSFNTADSPKEKWVRILGTLSHASGHSREYHIDLPPDEVGAKGNVNKTQVHATGSTNSYARRYLICMMFNLTTEDDNDGNREKNVMPDAALADWTAKIDEVQTMDEAAALWQEIAQATTAAHDVEAHEQLRGAMTARRKAIKESAK